MSSVLKRQLEKVKEQESRINPDGSWVARNREKLLAQTRNTVVEEKPHFRIDYIWQAINIFVPGRLAYTVVRPAVVFLLVGAMATSGWIASVSATQNCLPGEICYGVKLATEKTQELVTVVAGAKEQQAQMHMEFATRRAKEAKKVVENNAVDAPQRAAEAMHKLEKSVQSANHAIKVVAEENPGKAVEAVKDMQEKAKEINQTLTDVAAQSGAETGVNVAGAKQVVKDSSLEVVEAMVQKKESGATDVSDEAVKGLVKTQIDAVLRDVGETQGRAADAVMALESASTTPSGLSPGLVITVSSTILVATSSMQAVVSSTEQIVFPTSTIKTVLGEASKQAVAQGQESQKTLEEAKVLVDGNHLLEAIGKVKDATQTAQQAERTVIEVNKAVDVVNNTAQATTTTPVNIKK
ncbi:MAG: hypothetical protein HY980_00915 [Candidatus Magasanikbacteria bacterium]|nr:hypothetical protein [Candidatus Magasanikbacteria bacterium]